MSILNVNKINPVGGGSTITIAGIASVTSSVTAPSFVGAVTGNVTGNSDTASGLSGNPSINTTGIVTATSFVPTVGQLSHRNLIINGDMRIAQRGTSSTSTGYGSVDRFNLYHANTGVTITQSQQSSVSSDTPYTLGFRKFFRIALASAGTANANAEIGLTSHLEAQDVANSGWNHTSSTSNITLSFWFRCSTNQTFYAYLRSRDGTNQNYPFSFTASGNNAWTKITKTIPGNTNVQIDDNTERGLSINFIPFYGTDLTNNLSVDQWSAYDTANRMPDMASTWLTAGASTFDITGVQLEVGPVATPFEHRSHGDELARCHRYFFKWSSSMAYSNFNLGYAPGATGVETVYQLPVIMRANPSLATSGTFRFVGYSGSAGQDSSNLSSITVHRSHTRSPYIRAVASGLSSGLIGEFGDSGSNNATMSFDAEL